VTPRRWWPSLPGSAALLLVLAALSPPSSPAAEPRTKSIFRSQPTEWNPELGEAPAMPIVFRPAWTFSGFVAPLAGDPAMADGRLAAAAADGVVALLDAADGRTLWMTDLREPIATGPAIDGGLLLVATVAGRLQAMDPADGTPRWTADLGSPATAPPRSAGGCLLVTTAAPALVAIEPGTGAVLGRLGLPGRASAAAEPAGGDAIVGTDHGMVLRVVPRTLEVVWRRYLRLPVTGPPLIRDDRLYIAAGHTLRVLRLRDGKPRWTARASARIAARPFTSGPYIYFQCFDNDIYVLKAGNGHLMARVRLAHRLNAEPLPIATHVLVAPATEGSLIGLSLPALQQAGRFDLGLPGEWFTTAPVGAADRLAVGYGRNEARILALVVEPAPPAAPGVNVTPGGNAAPAAGDPPAAGATGPVPGSPGGR
jgi:outer membrane protein assembly factor BamB